MTSYLIHLEKITFLEGSVLFDIATVSNNVATEILFQVLQAVVCAILASIIGLKPSSSAQVFGTCDCLKLLSIHFDLCVYATGVVCHQLGLLDTDLHAVGCGGFVKTLN